MRPKNKENGLYGGLKKLITSEDNDNLLSELKEKAKNIDLEEREKFTDTLLKFAANKSNKGKQSIIFHALASLESIWKENIPKQNLVRKFENAYREGKYEEAGHICSELIEQGPDYLGEVNLEKGILLPIDTGENQYVLHYSEKVLRFFDLDLRSNKSVKMPDGAKIIDVLPPNKYIPEDAQDVDKKIWILKESKLGKRSIVPMDVHEKTFTGTEIQVAKNLNSANRISRFKGHLLLVSEESISYYKQDKKWKEWFGREGAITCTESTNDFFWVGLSDGNVRILKNLELKGVRGRFEPLPDAIKTISSSNRVVSVSSENLTTIRNIENVPISTPFQTASRIIQTEVLNSKMVVSHLSNGSIIGRNIKDGNIGWEINPNEIYDSLFSIENRIYLFKNSGMAAVFSLPDIDRMVNFLKVQNIEIKGRSIESEAEAPVKDLSEFIGRKKLLQEIKKNDDFHFLVSGGAKTGRTSLLNILGEHLSGNAVDCYIDMEHLLEKVDSYEDFEKKFIILCLSQHKLKLEDLHFGTSFQRFRAMISKIKGARRYCLFCLDNFSLPKQLTADREWRDGFIEFMKDMYVYPDSRIILTCGKNEKEEVERYFRVIEKSLPGDRTMRQDSLSLFSEDETAGAIGKITRTNREESEKLYRYSGRFPHLIKLYKNFNRELESIDVYSDRLARNSYESIFDYFRELSPEARLLLAAVIHENVLKKRIGIDDFYRDLLLLEELIPQAVLKDILAETQKYCDGFTIEKGENEFLVNIPENALLFSAAAKQIPWFKVFIELYKFRAHPRSETADEIVKNYRLAARISLDTERLVENWSKQEEDEYFSDLREKHEKNFYIREITADGRVALGMDRISFIVLPLKSWEEKKTDFKKIHEALCEYVQRSGASGKAGQAGAKFYILFFEFLGAEYESIKKDISDIEGICIIDTLKMKDIFLARDPLLKSSEEIRRQLAESKKS